MPDPSRALLRSMASAFEGVVRSVVRELDRSRELIPVDSLLTSSSYQPYCLVGRKCSISSFWRPRYTCVNLSMKDILEPNAPEPGTPPGAEAEPRPGGEQMRPACRLLGASAHSASTGQGLSEPLRLAGQTRRAAWAFSSGLVPAVERVGPFHFHDTMDGQLQGSVELAAAGQGMLAGGAMVSGSSSASMNVCMLRVAPNTWEALHQER